MSDARETNQEGHACHGPGYASPVLTNSVFGNGWTGARQPQCSKKPRA